MDTSWQFDECRLPGKLLQRCSEYYVCSIVKKFVFLKSLIYSPRLHLFDQNKVKTVIVGENKI